MGVREGSGSEGRRGDREVGYALGGGMIWDNRGETRRWKRREVGRVFWEGKQGFTLVLRCGKHRRCRGFAGKVWR